MRTHSKKLAVLGLALSLSALGAQTASAVTDVKDVDQPARRPKVMYTYTLDNSNPGGTVVGTVPSDYRFVIEFVSAICTSIDGYSPLLIVKAPAYHYFGVTTQRDKINSVFSHPTRIYVSPGTAITVDVRPGPSVDIDCDLTLSGHLVAL